MDTARFMAELMKFSKMMGKEIKEVQMPASWYYALLRVLESDVTKSPRTFEFCGMKMMPNSQDILVVKFHDDSY